jgi:flagellar biosynthesis protein FlhG
MTDTALRSICVASGKGGVGKTSFAVNLALTLARQNLRVLLFDGDMGLANTQIALNVRLPANSIADNESNSYKSFVIKTDFGFDLLPGASGKKELANMNYERTIHLVRNFDEFSMDYDILVVDAAAGISPAVLALLESTDIRLIIGTNEPASITDAYGLIKALNEMNVKENLFFIPNRVSARDGKILYNKMNEVCLRFLSLELGSIGHLSDDPYMTTCWKKSIPLVEMAPQSQIALEIDQLVRALLKLIPTPENGKIKFFKK